MRQVTNRSRCFLVLAAAVCSLPALAQTTHERDAAREAWQTITHAAMKEIAADPCNAQGRIAEMQSRIAEVATQIGRKTDDIPGFLRGWVQRGCENSRLELSDLELLVSAGTRGYLDPCTYSPTNDYSVEISMAKLSFARDKFRIVRRFLSDTPCIDAFIAAAIARTPLATVPSGAEPTPADASQPTRRRRASQ